MDIVDFCDTLVIMVRAPTTSMVNAKVDILIVDDNPANLAAIEAVLDDLGENVVRAGSGSEALRQLLDRDFALIILDVRMMEIV